jgi:hypothetical protein
VEAAVALTRLGDPSGPDALERLAYSSDDAVRLQVAAAMGELARAEFLPALIRFLDDRQSIRRAALESLPRVAGRDVAEEASGGARGANGHVLDFAQRIDLWKQWYAWRRSDSSQARFPDEPY